MPIPNIKLAKNEASSFWLDSTTLGSAGRDDILLDLYYYKKICKNFIRIRTGTSMDVQFADSTNTIGRELPNRVLLNSDISDANFDTNIGLALHESGIITEREPYSADLSRIAKVINKAQYERHVAYLYNVLETFRIDHRTATVECPGYMPYFISLYQKYFYNDEIKEALETYMVMSVDCYIFHITNSIHPAFDSAKVKLPAFDEVLRMVDIPNIDRLEDGEDSLNLAFEVIDFIYSQFKEEDEEDALKEQRSKAEDILEQIDQNQTNPVRYESKLIEKYLKDKQQNKARRLPAFDNFLMRDRDTSDAITEQIQYIENKLKKDILDGDSQFILSMLDTTNSNVRSVTITDADTNEAMAVRTLTVNDPTEEFLMKMGLYTHPLTMCKFDGTNMNQIDLIQDAIAKGRTLAHRLKFRDIESTILFNRQLHGKLDKRMVHSIPFNDALFLRKESDSYKKAHVHISLDVSGSMANYPITHAKHTIAMIASALTNLASTEVVITLKASMTVSRDGIGKEVPALVRIYDSRVHRISRLQHLLQVIPAAGTTPEGLLFPEIHKMLPTPTDNLDVYFINVTDGVPYFEHFGGDSAINFTKNKVREIEEAGVSCLGYYIANSSGVTERDYFGTTFKRMFRRNAKRLFPNSINRIAKDVNSLLVTK